MRKKIIILCVIVLTLLCSASLTSCNTSGPGHTYFPEGIWDEFE